jgi:hypothetical protein
MSKERRPDDHPERGDSTAADAVGESADESSEDTASESAGGGDTFTSSRRSVLTGLGAAGLGLGSGQLGVVGTASAAGSLPPAIENLYVASNVGIHSYTTSDSHGDSPKSFYRPYTASYGGFGDSWGGLTGFIPPGDSAPSVYGVADENSKDEKVVAVPTNNGDFSTTPTNHRTLKMHTQDGSASVNEGIDIFTTDSDLFAAAEVDTNTSGLFRWYPAGEGAGASSPHFLELDASSVSGYDFGGVPSTSYYDAQTTAIYTAYQTTFDRQIVKYAPPPFGSSWELGADDGAITYPDPDGLLQSLEIRDFARCQFSNDPETDSTLYALVGGQTDQGYFAGIIERTGENTWSPVQLPDVPTGASIVPESGPANAIMNAGIPKQMVAADNVLFFRTVNFGDDWVVGVDPRYAGGPDKAGHISVTSGVGSIGTLFVDPSTDGVYDAASDCITRRTPSDSSIIFGTENEYCDLFADAARTSAVTSVTPKCDLDALVETKNSRISQITANAAQTVSPDVASEEVDEKAQTFVNDVDNDAFDVPEDRLCEAMERLNDAENVTLETTQAITDPGDNVLRTAIDNLEGALWGKIGALIGGDVGGLIRKVVAKLGDRVLSLIQSISGGLYHRNLIPGGTATDISSHAETARLATSVEMDQFAQTDPAGVENMLGGVGGEGLNYFRAGGESLKDQWFGDAPTPLDVVEKSLFNMFYFDLEDHIQIDLPNATDINAMLEQEFSFDPPIPGWLADLMGIDLPIEFSMDPPDLPDLDVITDIEQGLNNLIEDPDGVDAAAGVNPALASQVTHLRNNLAGLGQQDDSARHQFTQRHIGRMSGYTSFTQEIQGFIDQIGDWSGKFNKMMTKMIAGLAAAAGVVTALTAGAAAPAAGILLAVAGSLAAVVGWVGFIAMWVDLFQGVIGLLSMVFIAGYHGKIVELIVQSQPGDLEALV